MDPLACIAISDFGLELVLGAGCFEDDRRCMAGLGRVTYRATSAAGPGSRLLFGELIEALSREADYVFANSDSAARNVESLAVGCWAVFNGLDCGGTDGDQGVEF